jgi:hypothetical protein
VIRRKLRAWLGITSPAQLALERARQQLEGDVAAYMSGFDAGAEAVGLGVLPYQRYIVEHEYRNRRLFEIANPSIGKRRNA